MSRRGVVIVEDRRRAAAILRRFASGRLHVDDFEDQFYELDWSDRAISRAFWFAWSHYCDYRTEHLTGPWKLTREMRHTWAKWTLYLLTDDQPFAYASVGKTRLLRLFGRGDDFLPEDGAHLTKGFWPFIDQLHLKRCEAVLLSR